MLELYFAESATYREKLNEIIFGKLNAPFTIKRTQNGKPYIEGNPLFFSVSHSGDTAVIAISDKPVGVDLEVVRERKYESVLSRFTPRERAEICSFSDFLKHWVVREAYIKLHGDTLAEMLNSLEYTDGVLKDGGKAASCAVQVFDEGDLIYAVCTAASEKITII